MIVDLEIIVWFNVDQSFKSDLNVGWSARSYPTLILV